MAFLGMTLTLVRGLGQLSALAPHLDPILLLSDLLKIETVLPDIETGRSRFQTGRPRFQQVGKMLVQSYIKRSKFGSVSFDISLSHNILIILPQ